MQLYCVAMYVLVVYMQPCSCTLVTYTYQTNFYNVVANTYLAWLPIFIMQGTYRIAGYFRRRKFRTSTPYLNLEEFNFVATQ